MQDASCTIRLSVVLRVLFCWSEGGFFKSRKVLKIKQMDELLLHYPESTVVSQFSCILAEE